MYSNLIIKISCEEKGLGRKDEQNERQNYFKKMIETDTKATTSNKGE